MPDAPDTDNDMKKNAKVAIACVTFVSVMVGVSFAAVPLYDLFCRVTGFGGTTQVAENAPDQVIDREITIRFDANVSGGLNWTFKPEVREVTLKVGETARINYIAQNNADVTTVGTSTFNVTPPQSGAYFNKLACFCFNEQPLAPGESISMPVEFFVSPGVVEDSDMDSVTAITLSYTFFPVNDPETIAHYRDIDRDGTDGKTETQGQSAL